MAFRRKKIHSLTHWAKNHHSKCLQQSSNYPWEQCVPVATWKNPAAGQDPQLQTVPWVPGQPHQEPLLQPLLGMHSPLQKPEDGQDAGFPPASAFSFWKDSSRSGPQPPVWQLLINSDYSPFSTSLGVPVGGQVPPASSNDSAQGLWSVPLKRCHLKASGAVKAGSSSEKRLGTSELHLVTETYRTAL